MCKFFDFHCYKVKEAVSSHFCVCRYEHCHELRLDEISCYCFLLRDLSVYEVVKQFETVFT